MKPLKIVLIGAGSAAFGLMTMKDLIDTPAIHGSEVVLVDIVAEKVERMQRLTQRMNEVGKANLKIWATTDRREALPGADVVVTSVERA
ncbi:MAG: alpha-glucosidase/alpha-galactosidase, partial [Anaerolineae bacterium]|nr:alpha-glucosidase/alpha-galactosidase [Anaerolineae bacterium]